MEKVNKMYSIEEFDDNQLYCITYQPKYGGKIRIDFVGEWYDVMEMWYAMLATDSFVSEVLWDRNQ